MEQPNQQQPLTAAQLVKILMAIGAVIVVVLIYRADQSSKQQAHEAACLHQQVTHEPWSSTYVPNGCSDVIDPYTGGAK